MIEKPKGKQDSYAKGDQITDHVKLHAIYTNRVILDRGGHYETLTLESVKKARSMADKSRQRAAGNAVSEQVAQSLNEARKKILADPSNASRYIRLRPARRSGKLVGYRIFPGSNGGLFKQAGLKSGELVTAINGKPLNKPAKALQQLSKLSDASSARITLERNGRKHTIVVNFK